MKDLVERLDDLDIRQEHMDPLEDIPDDIYYKYFKNAIKVKELDTSIYKWYETTTVVYKIQDHYIGIEYISNIYSENCDVSDIDFTLSFIEMKQEVTTTYVCK